jgi:uncharacterized protein (TIGR01777 family)
MRVVIAGGTGLLGTALADTLRASDHEVTTLTRHPRRADQVAWSPDPAARDTSWYRAIERADAVVNLAGESIAGARWTTARKHALRDSRVYPTRAIAAAVLAAGRRPGVLISGSAVGIYGTRGDESITEATPPGTDFLSELGTAWEAAAQDAATATRVILLRTGLVLASRGGALPRLARPFRWLAGGPLGSGRQYMSWIHLEDWVAMVMWALATPDVSGPLNATAPHPVTNEEFARTLGRVLRRPAWLRAPAFAVRIALGEMGETVALAGQRVTPAKAQSLGFEFRYPTLDAALRALYRV